jgi:hypothetical protein
MIFNRVLKSRGTGERQMLNGNTTQKFEKRIQYIQTCTKALHKNAFLHMAILQI